MSEPSPSASSALSRRDVLQCAAGLAVAAAATPLSAQEPAVTAAKGRIRQSIVQWCFSDYWKIEETAKIAVKLGVPSIELIPPAQWPILKQHGLTCAIASSHAFKVGMNNPANWDGCIARLTEAIDAAAAFGCRNVITFTGYADGMSLDEGLRNCVAGFKKIIGRAEEKGVNLCLEMLNTRDDSHPMKGHPGYQGDHTDYCIDIVKGVNSPRMKLLFDIYHVQIMEGDVIRRIRKYHQYIGHVHTAGNPGRGELDDAQEINYPPIMRALLETGYEGFVGQEFIPTRDPLEGLTQAVRLCDV